jgi:hypothetical protein
MISQYFPINTGFSRQIFTATFSILLYFYSTTLSYEKGNFHVQELIMAQKGNSGNRKPTPVPPNSGPKPAGWPSTTVNQSGNGRNNGPAKGK